MSDAVIYETRGPAAWITINRPEKMNALNEAVLAGLHELLDRAVADDEVKVVVVTGAGERAFSAGADIHEMAELSDEERARRNALRRDWTWAVADFPKPTIGALNGLRLPVRPWTTPIWSYTVACGPSSQKIGS